MSRRMLSNLASLGLQTALILRNCGGCSMAFPAGLDI